eukprot:TRINITY_DN29958_c0_g1_i1.p1 TRINITY_DN29958_c0_g1~~TRINITY_DN29958_c0_g1_i1.p1  ORF type:complete len:660 (-),score=100.59 TRINITY_DN29958_c0_g1_i1:78-2057(-)
MALTVPSRLINHTLVAAVLSATGVVSPLLLLLRSSPIVGAGAKAFAICLLTIGASSLLGSFICWLLAGARCNVWRKRLILVATWLLNPVVVVLFLQSSVGQQLWLSPRQSCLPLAFAVIVLAGRAQLRDGEPDWVQECFNPRGIIMFVFNRFMFIIVPLSLLSFQIALYLPSAATSLLPAGPDVGIFACGGCIIISGKIVAMCMCLANEKVAQAFVVVVMLCADWISCMNVMTVVPDELKEQLLVLHLLVAGSVQLAIALLRLGLRPRWGRYRAQMRTRVRELQVRGSADLELGANLTSVADSAALGASAVQNGADELSDSDDERGPGSLPDGFYETLLQVLGVPAPAPPEPRQYLCPLRRAVVRDASDQVIPGEGNPEPPPEGIANLAPIDVRPENKLCTVCLEDIKTGELVRPLPKCRDVFHAACLENYAKIQRRGTRCPNCRRPALIRECAEGAISVQSLTCDEDTRASAAPGERRAGRPAAGRGGGGGRGGGRGGQAGRGGRPTAASRMATGRSAAAGRGGRAAAQQPRTAAVAALRAVLPGCSEELRLAALETAGGALDAAVHLLLEHKAYIELAYGASLAPIPSIPAGVLEAFLAASPELAGSEEALQRQLAGLYATGRLQSSPWANVPPAARAGVFQVVLEDVSRGLEARQS